MREIKRITGVCLALLLLPRASFAAAQETAMDPAEIYFSPDYGSVEEIHRGDSGRLVIVLQDAHANELAQQNISKIIRSLHASYAMDLLGLEGSAGVVDTSLYATFPEREAKEILSAFLLKQGKISGAEFAGIMDERPLWVFGVEDPQLYLKNYDGLVQSMELRAQALDVLAKLSKQAAFLKEHMYSQELKQWEAALGAGTALPLLLQKAKETGVSLNGLAHIARYNQVLETEKSLEAKAVDQQRNEAIQKLSRVLPMQQLKELTASTIRWRKGDMSPLQFHERLSGLCAAQGMAFEMLSEYTQMLQAQSALDRRGIQADSDALAARVFERMAGPDDALKRLRKADQTLAFLNRFLRLRASAIDFAWYQREREAMSAAAIVSTLRALSETRGLGFDVAQAQIALLQLGVDKASDFYSTALKRDGVLAANLVAEMDQTGRKSAMLVAGGFHTAGICRYLKAKGFSYAVVLPKVADKTSEERYLALLMDKSTPYLDLYRKNRKADVLSGAIGWIHRGGQEGTLAMMQNAGVGDDMDSARPDLEARAQDIQDEALTGLAVASAASATDAEQMVEQWESNTQARETQANASGAPEFARRSAENRRLLASGELFPDGSGKMMAAKDLPADAAGRFVTEFQASIALPGMPSVPRKSSDPGVIAWDMDKEPHAGHLVDLAKHLKDAKAANTRLRVVLSTMSVDPQRNLTILGLQQGVHYDALIVTQPGADRVNDILQTINAQNLMPAQWNPHEDLVLVTPNPDGFGKRESDGKIKGVPAVVPAIPGDETHAVSVPMLLTLANLVLDYKGDLDTLAAALATAPEYQDLREFLQNNNMQTDAASLQQLLIHPGPVPVPAEIGKDVQAVAQFLQSA